jgi:hypothetical protein
MAAGLVGAADGGGSERPAVRVYASHAATGPREPATKDEELQEPTSHREVFRKLIIWFGSLKCVCATRAVGDRPGREYKCGGACLISDHDEQTANALNNNRQDGGEHGQRQAQTRHISSGATEPDQLFESAHQKASVSGRGVIHVGHVSLSLVRAASPRHFRHDVGARHRVIHSSATGGFFWCLVRPIFGCAILSGRCCHVCRAGGVTGQWP